MSNNCDCKIVFTYTKKYGAPDHGMKNSLMYTTLKSMKARCFSSNKPSDIRNYRGRGIGICEQWVDSFLKFYQDMGEKPSKEYSIDRIDNDKSYCPHNCRWATPKQQRENSRVVHKPKVIRRYKYVYIEFNGKKINLGKFENIVNIDYLLENSKFEIYDTFI